MSKGYGHPFGKVLDQVNGIKIKNLKHLVEVLRDAKAEFMVFQFAGRGTETLIFPRKELLAATDDILIDNGVRSQGSPELMEVWKGGK